MYDKFLVNNLMTSPGINVHNGELRMKMQIGKGFYGIKIVFNHSNKKEKQAPKGNLVLGLLRAEATLILPKSK
jgi:hypothetical protein